MSFRSAGVVACLMGLIMDQGFLSPELQSSAECLVVGSLDAVGPGGVVWFWKSLRLV